MCGDDYHAKVAAMNALGIIEGKTASTPAFSQLPPRWPAEQFLTAHGLNKPSCLILESGVDEALRQTATTRLFVCRARNGSIIARTNSPPKKSPRPRA